MQSRCTSTLLFLQKLCHFDIHSSDNNLRSFRNRLSHRVCSRQPDRRSDFVRAHNCLLRIRLCCTHVCHSSSCHRKSCRFVDRSLRYTRMNLLSINHCTNKCRLLYSGNWCSCYWSRTATRTGLRVDIGSRRSSRRIYSARTCCSDYSNTFHTSSSCWLRRLFCRN